MTQSTAFFPLGGGLDLISPALAIAPGRVIASINYEPVMNGYSRVAGYERFDGHAAPSSAFIAAVHFSGGNAAMGALAAGAEIYQQPAGQPRSATGYVLAAPILTDGSFDLGNAVGYVLIVPERGTFVEAATLFSGDDLGTQYGPLDTTPALAGYDPLDLIRYARLVLRERIGEVPGSGPVRGIWFSGSRAYAVRDSEDASEGIPYYSELNNTALVTQLTIGGDHITVGGLRIRLALLTEGWTAAATELVLPFTAGVVEPSEGDLLEQAGATAELRRLVVDSGGWGTGDAVGHAYVVSQTGAFAAGAVNVGATTVFTVAGDSTANSFPPGGRYQFITHNFYGASNLERVYGVNGVGPAFEFDGDTIVSIDTGMAIDTPTRIAAYRNQLFLAFPGGSLQNSAPGEPRVFNAVIGAAEIGTGNEITDLLPITDALAVFGSTSVHVLYGNNVTDFTFPQLTDEAGGLAWTAQRIGEGVYLDNRGLRQLKATAAYGGFSIGTLSMDIEPLLADLRKADVSPTASLVVRSKSQYWLFLEDSTAVVFLFGKKKVEALPVALGVKVTCAASVEDSGVERIFVGTDTGFVYEMNKGVSFDGTPITYYMRLPYNNFRSPQQLKRLHKVSIDMEVRSAITLNVSVGIDQGVEQTEEEEIVVTREDGATGDDFYELYFAEKVETVAEAYIQTAGKNFALKIAGSSDVEEVHTLTGVTCHVSPRGMQR